MASKRRKINSGGSVPGADSSSGGDGKEAKQGEVKEVKSEGKTDRGASDASGSTQTRYGRAIMHFGWIGDYDDDMHQRWSAFRDMLEREMTEVRPKDTEGLLMKRLHLYDEDNRPLVMPRPGDDDGLRRLRLRHIKNFYAMFIGRETKLRVDCWIVKTDAHELADAFHLWRRSPDMIPSLARESLAALDGAPEAKFPNLINTVYDLMEVLILASQERPKLLYWHEIIVDEPVRMRVFEERPLAEGYWGGGIEQRALGVVDAGNLPMAIPHLYVCLERIRVQVEEGLYQPPDRLIAHNALKRYAEVAYKGVIAEAIHKYRRSVTEWIWSRHPAVINRQVSMMIGVQLPPNRLGLKTTPLNLVKYMKPFFGKVTTTLRDKAEASALRGRDHR